VKQKWTRRKFLKTGLKGSVVIGGVAPGLVSPRPAVTSPISKTSSGGLHTSQREILRAAMDEIIPAAEGMPPASEVGGVEYLDQAASQSPDVKDGLVEALAALEALSRKHFGRGFSSLSRQDRVEALRKLEKQPAAKDFSTLRDFVYEAYYTQPAVWKLIGYEFHPTDHAGPKMKPFDEAVLAKVRQMPKRYREVS